MPYEPHRPTAGYPLLTRLAARRQFGGPVRGDGHDQTFRTVGEDEGDGAGDLARFAASQGTARDGVGANVKVVAIGNAKVKGSPDRRLA